MLKKQMLKKKNLLKSCKKNFLEAESLIKADFFIYKIVNLILNLNFLYRFCLKSITLVFFFFGGVG